MGRELHVIDSAKVAWNQNQMAALEHDNSNGETEWPGLTRMLNKRARDYSM